MDTYDKRVFANNLTRYMKLNNINQSDVAELLQVSKSTVSSWCKGEKTPRMGKVQFLADHFGIMKSDLIEDKTAPLPPGAVPYNPTHQIPVLGRISAGLPLYAEEHVDGYIFTELNGGSEYFALKVTGDSMNNRKIDDGDTVIIRRQEQVENGEIAVVMVGEDDATIKQFYQNENMITLVPHSSNPAHVPQLYNCGDTKIRVLGRLVRSIKDF